MQEFFEAWYGQLATAIVSDRTDSGGCWGQHARQELQAGHKDAGVLRDGDRSGDSTVLFEDCKDAAGRFDYAFQHVCDYVDRLFLRTGAGNSLRYGLWSSADDDRSVL